MTATDVIGDADVVFAVADLLVLLLAGVVDVLATTLEDCVVVDPPLPTACGLLNMFRGSQFALMAANLS